MTESDKALYIKRIKKWAHFHSVHQEWKSEKIEDILGQMIEDAEVAQHQGNPR